MQHSLKILFMEHGLFAIFSSSSLGRVQKSGAKRKKRGVSFAVYEKSSIFALGFQTADMAQLVEHFIRNERVRGSSPRVGSGVRGKSGSDIIFILNRTFCRCMCGLLRAKEKARKIVVSE